MHTLTTVTPADAAWLQTVQAAINQHLSDPQFDTHALGHSVQLNKNQLHQKVTSATGLSPGKLIRYQRLRHAAKLLHETTLSIKEVAAQTGFTDHAAFSRAFSIAFRCSPSTYRKHTQAQPIRYLFNWKVPIQEHDLEQLIRLARQHDWLANFLRMVIANLDQEDFTITELARQLCMSPSALTRKTRQLLNCSPARFIRQLRLQQAADLLQVSTISVASIAYECGFFDHAHFCRCFRQAFGCSPSEYRERTEWPSAPMTRISEALHPAK